jgi:hypothetical protein
MVPTRRGSPRQGLTLRLEGGSTEVPTFLADPDVSWPTDHWEASALTCCLSAAPANPSVLSTTQLTAADQEIW